MHGGGEPGITRVNLSPRMRLAEVIKRIEAIPMGGTDCALPMLWAARNKLNVSGFITYTDSETWAGNIHPAQALRQYRSEFVGDAKAVVVGMTSNGFTLADPNDRGMMDVVGFDTSAPAVIADFVRECLNNGRREPCSGCTNNWSGWTFWFWTSSATSRSPRPGRNCCLMW